MANRLGEARGWLALTPTLSHGEREKKWRARVEAAPVVCRGCPVCSVSADPDETQLEPSGVLVGSGFSSCLLQTRVTKTPGMAVNYIASTIGRKAAREDGFWLFTRTPG